MEKHFGEHVQVNFSAFTTEFVLRYRNEKDDPLTTIVIPHAVAKQICLIMRRGLKEVEKQMGEITLSQAWWEKLGIPPEEWGDWNRLIK